MNRQDHSIYREWINLEADGRLPRDERARLEQHLSSCASCRSELDSLLSLEGLMMEARVPVRGGFRADVLAALPPAGWEARAPRTWGFPVALCALLAVISAAVVGAAPGESSGLGALSAVFGMFRAAALAGSGLLGATWKGFGLVFEEMLASPMSLGMFGVFVLCLNILLVMMIRRRRTEAPTEAGAAASRTPRGLDDSRL
ncbi:MAG: zf-HC2 domain-containing protein [Acidobacteriota bacterium]